MMNLKGSYKPVIAIILAAALLSTIYAGIGSAFISGVSSKGADYVVLQGNAGNDYFDSRQYSYDVNTWAAANVAGYPALTPSSVFFNASKSIRMGMTAFGELATSANAGIAYGANSAEWQQTESWASVDINPQYYMQGWTFYMNYTRVGILRAIEAWAIFSDTATTEGGRAAYTWDGTHNPGDVNAQLTAGSLANGGVQVLYDSARLVIARASTTIHDAVYNEDVAKVTLTIVMNKDTKYAIIYKDVKMLLDTKILDNINDFAFSERYEIDLARDINPSNQAYIHYYGNYGASVYQHPLTGQNNYDVVQAFNPNRNYTFFAAYWPNTTEYTVYSPLVPNLPNNFTRVLPSGTATPDMPGSPSEPSTPWVIAQWRYNSTMWPKLLNFMAKSPNREFRFVEVAGMTDYNKYTGSSAAAAAGAAMDLNAGDGKNQVDAEIQYLLSTVFKPVDLKSINNAPFQWDSVGQQSIAADSAGAASLSDIAQLGWHETLGLFDRFDGTPGGGKGTIPYGLSNVGVFNGTASGIPYVESFSNSAKGTGTDTTTYWREGLNGFAFQWYSAQTTAQSPPQPIAGGFSNTSTSNSAYWYPSKNPLTLRWNGLLTATSPYAGDQGLGSNGMINVGGPKANWMSRYFNDFDFAIDREGTSAFALAKGGVVTGSAPTNNPTVPTFDFFPVSSWATSHTTFGYNNPDNTAGFAVISLATDVNGTRGLSVYGWDARDTYWASAWAGQYLSAAFNGWVPTGTVALILKISYSSFNNEPTGFTVVRDLGTITELGANAFSAAAGFDVVAVWSGSVSPPATPITVDGLTSEWWYAKLPTTSTALVDFDP